MSRETPREADAVTRTAAVALHDLFISLTDAGFTEPQAAMLLGAMVAATSTNEGPS